MLAFRSNSIPLIMEALGSKKTGDIGVSIASWATLSRGFSKCLVSIAGFMTEALESSNWKRRSLFFSITVVSSWEPLSYPEDL